MIEILGIGEALIEFAQIERGQFMQSFAGDVLNTLYYCSKFGLRTSFLSTLGSDSFTNDLIVFLDTASIDHSHCQSLEGKNNGLYIIRNAPDGEPQFTFFRNTSAAREAFNESLELPDARAIVFSAIGLAVFHHAENLFIALEKAKETSLLYFDLNIRESLWHNKNDLIGLLPRLASIVTVLSLSKSDDRALFGDRHTNGILSYYTKLGFSHVILRDGGNELSISLNGELLQVPVEEVDKVVDATGAGDAFNAGYLYGMLNELDAKESAQVGNRAARQVLQNKGGIVESFNAPL